MKICLRVEIASFWSDKIITPAPGDQQPVTHGARTSHASDGLSSKMNFPQVFWVICSVFVMAHGAPKPPGEIADHGNKDIGDIEEGLRNRITTQLPELPPNMAGDIAGDVPENWDQSKDDAQSLFLNKSDKNDQEPYPMALSDDVYDGQPIRAGAEPPRAAPGMLEHVIMRSELYGEPPSANPARLALRRKRANAHPLRADLGTTLSRVSKMAPRYSTINRFKRESNMRSEDILALLSLWEAQQRRNNEAASINYSPDSYYGVPEQFYNGPEDREDADERWLDEPAIPSHFSRPLYALHPPKQGRYQYSHAFPDMAQAEPPYLQNLEALRRKRQWAGFGNRNHLAKRFMVAKKRSSLNYRPHDDLYTLNELLQRSSANGDSGYPISRRMIL